MWRKPHNTVTVKLIAMPKLHYRIILIIFFNYRKFFPKLKKCVSSLWNTAKNRCFLQAWPSGGAVIRKVTRGWQDNKVADETHTVQPCQCWWVGLRERRGHRDLTVSRLFQFRVCVLGSSILLLLIFWQNFIDIKTSVFTDTTIKCKDSNPSCHNCQFFCKK